MTAEGRSYENELAVARQAARDAGALLRAELARGPRGGDGVAPADGEAEAIIFEKLASSFPSYGTRMEERAEHCRSGSDAEGHLWLVDPNDGTRRFLKGERGTATSIALLRRGIPILGVVYAFATEANGGPGEDLLAWAEGGDFTRNGRAVVRPPWPERLSPDEVVFITASRSARAEALRVAAGARAVSGPSLAYRLARVAAGDGAAAFSLRGPKSWDYAGAHALLRATGGSLVDERCREVVYGNDGTGAVRACFGGGPAIVPELVSAMRDRPGPHLA
jgi:fructose-1,6-bisphosphatase/inositol monophosphatase family enzyme